MSISTLLLQTWEVLLYQAISMHLNGSPPNLGRSDQSRHQNQTNPMVANPCWIPPPEQDLISSCDKKKPKKSFTSSIDFFSRRLLPLPIAPDPKAMARMTIWPVVTLSSNVHWNFFLQTFSISLKSVFKCSLENGLLPTSSRVSA